MTGVVDVVTVGDEDEAVRLDRWFRRHYPGLAHGRLEKLLRTGQVRVDGKRARAGDRVASGQQIRVPPLPDTPAPQLLPAQIRTGAADDAALRSLILHRDDAVIVL